MARTENEKEKDGTPIEVIKKAIYGSSDKSGSIVPFINGHVFTIVFCENLGQVDVEIVTTSGTTVQFTSVLTPNGIQCYIPNAGNYVVTFTLPDGDEYYGEFTVTD